MTTYKKKGGGVKTPKMGLQSDAASKNNCPFWWSNRSPFFCVSGQFIPPYIQIVESRNSHRLIQRLKLLQWWFDLCSLVSPGQPSFPPAPVGQTNAPLRWFNPTWRSDKTNTLGLAESTNPCKPWQVSHLQLDSTSIGETSRSTTGSRESRKADESCAAHYIQSTD